MLVSEKRLKTDVIPMRFEPGEKERFKDAAKVAGLDSVSTWLRMIARKEADKLLGKQKPKRS